MDKLLALARDSSFVHALGVADNRSRGGKVNALQCKDSMGLGDVMQCTDIMISMRGMICSKRCCSAHHAAPDWYMSSDPDTID